jgi:hypothetical protein
MKLPLRISVVRAGRRVRTALDLASLPTTVQGMTLAELVERYGAAS